MIKNLGVDEIILISFVLIILFGSKKIPEFIRGVAKTINEFRNPNRNMPETDKQENEQ